MVVDKFDWGETGPALWRTSQRLERLDKEIVRAYHRPEREAMEGHQRHPSRSGRARPGRHHGQRIGSTPISCQFNEQTFNRYLVTNKGPDAAGSMYWKPTPLTTRSGRSRKR
jgi:hypothetical protein